MSTTRLYLLDGSGYLYRAFYGVRELARRDGFPTNAIFGFIRMLRKVMDEHRPDRLAIVFDTGGPNFRHQLDKDYKAHRKPMPDDLRIQIPVIRQMIAAYHIPVFSQEDFEADDLLGALAVWGRRLDWEVVIVTGDKDLMQLVEPGVSLYDPAKEKWLREAEVVDFWGVPPGQVVEVMALAGDASDNIPGVPGIGILTAAPLIRQYGDLEGLLANLEEIRQPKRRENLRQYAEQARLSRQLATIRRQMPLAVNADEMAWQEPDWPQLRRIFQEMEFSSLVKELDNRQQPRPQTVVTEPIPIPETLPVSLPASLRLDYHTLTDMEAFLAWLPQLAQQTAFALDTETTAVDPMRAELVGLSFAWQEGQAWYLPVGHQPEAAPNGQLDRDQVLATLRPILENSAIAKTGQNLKYEWVIFQSYGIHLAGITRDTMLFSYLVHGVARRHNLDAIARDELGRTTTTYKETTGSGRQQLRFDHVPLERAAPYACEDAEVAWAAADRLQQRLASQPALVKLYQEVELPLIEILARMEMAGVLVDREVLSRMSVDFTKRREILVQEIHAMAGEVFNVNSTQQLGQILFEKLGIKGGKKTKTGFSTDVEVLTKLAEAGHPMPEKVLQYRTLTKLQSTYTDALMTLIHPKTGRVHTSYNQAATLTGRLSSSDPNVQNIPIRTEEGRAIRRAFVAPPGHWLVCADYSQIELRILAHLADVPRLRRAFAQGADIHAATAAEIFGLPTAEVTPDQRRMAKTINFGLIYGMSVFGLAKRLGIALPLARRFVESYFIRYAGVKDYMNQAVEQARRLGYAETLLGRRCPIREITSPLRTVREEAERTAINAPIQGSAADIIKLAMIRLDQALRAGPWRSRMILQVHDELILEVPEDEWEPIQGIIRQAMEGAVELAVPLVVDIGRGRHWAEAH